MEDVTQSDEGKRPSHSRVRQPWLRRDHPGGHRRNGERVAQNAGSRVRFQARALAEVINPEAFGAHGWQLIEELRATEDPSRRLALVAQITRQAYEPLASELELLRTACAVAPELAELAGLVEARRRENKARLMAFLSERGGAASWPVT